MSRSCFTDAAFSCRRIGAGAMGSIVGCGFTGIQADRKSIAVK